MKFYLCTSGYFYSDDSEIEKLKKLGFRFLDYTGFILPDQNKKKIIESKGVTIEINTLEELIALVAEYGKLIISEDGIEIYDNHRE